MQAEVSLKQDIIRASWHYRYRQILQANHCLSILIPRRYKRCGYSDLGDLRQASVHASGDAERNKLIVEFKIRNFPRTFLRNTLPSVSHSFQVKHKAMMAERRYS